MIAIILTAMYAAEIPAEQQERFETARDAFVSTTEAVRTLHVRMTRTPLRGDTVDKYATEYWRDGNRMRVKEETRVSSERYFEATKRIPPPEAKVDLSDGVSTIVDVIVDGPVVNQLTTGTNRKNPLVEICPRSEGSKFRVSDPWLATGWRVFDVPSTELSDLLADRATWRSIESIQSGTRDVSRATFEVPPKDAFPGALVVVDLSPEHGWLPARVTARMGDWPAVGSSETTVVIEEFQAVGKSRFYPKVSKFEFRAGAGGAEVGPPAAEARTEFDVVEINLPIDAGVFIREIPDGAIVMDHQRNEQHRSKSDGSPVTEPVPIVGRRAAGSPAPSIDQDAARRVSLSWLIGLNGVVLLIIVAWFVIRRRVSRSASAQK
jgi:hypothetical protein